MCSDGSVGRELGPRLDPESQYLYVIHFFNLSFVKKHKSSFVSMILLERV